MAGFLGEAAARMGERARLISEPPRPWSLRGAIEESLSRGGAGLIIEFKRCSPRGLVAYLTPWEFHEAFSVVADAYSVLVEPYWFCGSLELVPWFSRFKPVLAKDLTVSEVQLEAYKAVGASAALLIVDLVGWRGLERLYAAAEDLGLEVLIEASNARDAVEAMASYPRALVGINARRLDTLSLDFDAAVAEIERAAAGKPSGAILVAESGVDSLEKARRALEAGADALLIGTWAMRSPREASKALSTLRAGLGRG